MSGNTNQNRGWNVREEESNAGLPQAEDYDPAANYEIDVSAGDPVQTWDEYGLEPEDSRLRQYEGRAMGSENPPPYRDEDWLRGKYLGEGMNAVEIADMIGCSSSVIYNWLERFGIERRTDEPDDPRFRDAGWLRERYVEDDMSQGEIARLCGVERPTIYRWLNRHGIERRPVSRQASWHNRRDVAYFRTHGSGYERWQDAVGGKAHVRVHSLLAIAEGCPSEKVFSSRYEIHHKNGVPWDNRPENIELLSVSDHRRLHAPDSVPSPERGSD